MTNEPQDGGPRPSKRFAGIAAQRDTMKPDYTRLGRKPDQSMIEAPERPSTQVSKHPDAQTPERKRQTVYLTPALIRRIKHYVADSGEEISEVAEQALTEFLDRNEGGTVV